MRSHAVKYFAYARECERQALEAEDNERRKRLLELARDWTEAALLEERGQQDQQEEGSAELRMAS